MSVTHRVRAPHLQKPNVATPEFGRILLDGIHAQRGKQTFEAFSHLLFTDPAMIEIGKYELIILLQPPCDISLGDRIGIKVSNR